MCNTVALADQRLTLLINIRYVCERNVEMILYYMTAGFHLLGICRRVLWVICFNPLNSELNPICYLLAL